MIKISEFSLTAAQEGLQACERSASRTTYTRYTRLINYALQQGVELARSGQIAKAFGISTGYVSITLLWLAENGLIIHQPHAGVKLTELGRTRSRRFVRRFRITELSLETLLNWNQESVAAKTHQLEPAISDRQARITRTAGRLGSIRGIIRCR